MKFIHKLITLLFITSMSGVVIAPFNMIIGEYIMLIAGGLMIVFMLIDVSRW